MPDSATTEWIRIESDEGDFSFLFPKRSKLVVDRNGFTTGDSTSEIPLKEMRILNAYVDDTFLSVESYRASRNALDALREIDYTSKRAKKGPDIKIGETKVRQVIFQSGKAQLIRRYFRAGEYIYILNAGMRGDETAAAKQFFDSVKLEQQTSTDHPVSKLSQLPVTKVTIEQIDPDPKGEPKRSDQAKPQPSTDSSLVLLAMPRASYTGAARDANVQGDIRLKITLLNDGFISKVVVVGKGLSGGITRQAIFNALRIKYLPKLVDGKPVSTVITVDYGFNIY